MWNSSSFEIRQWKKKSFTYKYLHVSIMKKAFWFTCKGSWFYCCRSYNIVGKLLLLLLFLSLRIIIPKQFSLEPLFSSYLFHYKQPDVNFITWAVLMIYQYLCMNYFNAYNNAIWSLLTYSNRSIYFSSRCADGDREIL